MNFKEFFLQEDKKRNEYEGKIKMLLYGQNFILFFKFQNDLYGATEDSRLTFASMKSEEDGCEDMVFGALNLSKAIKGNPEEEFFILNDINEIDVLSPKETEELLFKMAKNTKKKIPSDKLRDVRTNLKSKEKDTVKGLHNFNKDIE